jgi:hypothetical protein
MTKTTEITPERRAADAFLKAAQGSNQELKARDPKKTASAASDFSAAAAPGSRDKEDIVFEALLLQVYLTMPEEVIAANEADLAPAIDVEPEEKRIPLPQIPGMIVPDAVHRIRIQAKELTIPSVSDNSNFAPLLRREGYPEKVIPYICAMHDLIGQAESGRNYNIAFGGRRVNLTSMTLDEVCKWQQENNPPGNATAATGYCQIIEPTLRGLMKSMHLSGNELFNEDMQNRMTLELMRQRGLDRHLNGDMSTRKFVNGLANEWASLKNFEGRGMYDGDGVNTARHDIRHIVEQTPKIS